MSWVKDDSGEYIYVNVEEIVGETEAAFLLKLKNYKNKIWLPKSQIADVNDYMVGDKNLGISITSWIADRHNIENEPVK